MAEDLVLDVLADLVDPPTAELLGRDDAYVVVVDEPHLVALLAARKL